MRLGLIGFGEAGYAIASGLMEAGLKEIFAFDSLCLDSTSSTYLANRAQTVGTKLLLSPEEVLEKCTVIILAVSKDSLSIIQSIESCITKEHLFIDICVTSPELKKQIWALIEDSGALYVDAAVLGSIYVLKHQAPIIASGSGVHKFQELMFPYGMDITDYGTEPGDATTVKLVRSIFTKGLEALCLEVLETAARLKVEDLVLDSIANTLDSSTFLQTMNRLVTGSVIHSRRQVKEINAAIELAKKLNIDPVMSKAAKERISRVSVQDSDKQVKKVRPISWREVIK